MPVVTVDGPSGVGKGTISRLLANDLGWRLLDSGALYRAVGWACHNRQQAAGRELTEAEVAELARGLDLEFHDQGASGMQIVTEGRDISRELRTEPAGQQASRVAALPAVRDALLQRQRAFCTGPGLVADGRDMGTVVFPDAPLKLFLTASAPERAERRRLQLLEKGESVSLPRLLEAIEERDLRDRTRSVAPLRPADDAMIIDTTGVSVDDVYAQVRAAALARELVKDPR